jgi:hypothetical protein
MLDRCERRSACIALAGDQAVFVVVGPRKREPRVGVRTRCPALDVAKQTIAQHRTLPVGFDAVLKRVQPLGRRRARNDGLPLQHLGQRSVLSVQQRRVLQILHELLHVHHLEDLHRLLMAVVRIETERRAHAAIGRAFLRGDEDDPVRPAAAVDRRGCGVFQHLDGFDHLGGEVLDAAVDRNAVDDEERLVARVGHGADAAHAHLHRSSRLVARGDDLDARCTTLQRLHRIARRNVAQLLGTHRRDGAGDLASLLRAVPDDDSRLELQRAAGQNDVGGDSLASRDGHHLRFRVESDRRDAKGTRPDRYLGERVRAVAAGEHRGSGALDGDACAGDGSLGERVEHRAADGAVLGLRLSAGDCEDRQEQKNEPLSHRPSGTRGVATFLGAVARRGSPGAGGD